MVVAYRNYLVFESGLNGHLSYYLWEYCGQIHLSSLLVTPAECRPKMIQGLNNRNL